MRDRVKEIARPYNIIKGRVTEGIIRELFTQLGMTVYPNGYELTHPQFAQDLREGKLDPKSLEEFRQRPDFIIHDYALNKNGHRLVYHVEVKYRKKGQIGLSDLKHYKTENLIFIFVNHEGFWCATKSEIDLYKERTKKSIHFSELTPLREHLVFRFSEDEKETIQCFRTMIGSTLENFDANKDLEQKIEAQLLGKTA